MPSICECHPRIILRFGVGQTSFAPSKVVSSGTANRGDQTLTDPRLRCRVTEDGSQDGNGLRDLRRAY